MTDTNRGTGRTQMKIRSSLLAALLGRRVLHVSVSREQANAAREYTLKLLNDSFDIPGQPLLTHSVSGNTIQFYRPQGGEHGIIRFTDMHAQPDGESGINTGLRGPQLYALTFDHHVLEKREAERQRLERVAAEQQIVLLMKKHGIRSVLHVGTALAVTFTNHQGGMTKIEQPE